jgi:hypothetical protein
VLIVADRSAIVASKKATLAEQTASKHRAGNNCPVFLPIITAERDGYFGTATVISRPMLSGLIAEFTFTLPAAAGTGRGRVKFMLVNPCKRRTDFGGLRQRIEEGVARDVY